MRIALDVTPAVRQGGGIGRYSRELARELVLRGRHEYVLWVGDRAAPDARRRLGLAPTDPAARSVAARLPHRLLTILWHRLGIALPLEWWTGALDLVHAPDFLAPPTRRARSVVTVHDLSFLTHPECADPGLARHLARRVPEGVEGAAHVLADSQNTRSDLQQRLGVAAARVTVAYPGTRMTPPTTAGWEADIRTRYALRRPYVLGVGTLEPRKDWPALVRAFDGAALDDHELVIAGGEGWLTEPIHRAVEGARAPVRLLGFVPDADLPALYAAATAFAYPSRYEGFGLPPLEAMACGTPCVVTGTGSLPEVVGDAALLVPPGDIDRLAEALRRLTADDALRRRLGRAGRNRAAGFTWSRTAAAAEEAFERATGAPREAGSPAE